jgi:hypothetical protein
MRSSTATESRRLPLVVPDFVQECDELSVLPGCQPFGQAALMIRNASADAMERLAAFSRERKCIPSAIARYLFA